MSGLKSLLLLFCVLISALSFAAQPDDSYDPKNPRRFRGRNRQITAYDMVDESMLCGRFMEPDLEQYENDDQGRGGDARDSGF